MPEPSGQFVQSLARGLSIIKTFDADDPKMPLTEIATRAQLSRATARRFLLTLEELGYVNFDGKLFSLTPKILELGYSYLSGLGLPELAQPHLEKFSHKSGESASLSVLNDTSVVYVARVMVKKIMTVNISIGTTFPAYTTSMGRVLLAYQSPEVIDRTLERSEIVKYTERTLTSIADIKKLLAKIREQGYALNQGELEEGLISLAVPIFNKQQEVIAAINCAVAAALYTADEMVKTFLPDLQNAAQSIENDYRLLFK